MVYVTNLFDCYVCTACQPYFYQERCSMYTWGLCLHLVQYDCVGVYYFNTIQKANTFIPCTICIVPTAGSASYQYGFILHIVHTNWVLLNVYVSVCRTE